MKSVLLYYFSGSGNTFSIVNQVQKTFEGKFFKCEIKKMEDVENIDLENHDYVGLLFPVAIQSTFPLVWDFIKRMPITKGQKIFMIDTMEAYSGGVVGPVKKVLRKKGYECLGALEVKMSSSMRTKEINRNEVQQKNNKAMIESETFILEMLEGRYKWRRLPVLSDLMRQISKPRRIWTKTSQQLDLNHDQCVKCGVCIRNCPTQALSMVHEKIAIDHERCMSCMRCVHHCPKDAFIWKGQKVIRTE